MFIPNSTKNLHDRSHRILRESVRTNQCWPLRLVLWFTHMSLSDSHGWFVVLADNEEAVEVEDDHQEVLDGEEDEHLMDNAEVEHDGEAHDQEGPVLDEEALHDLPDVATVAGQDGVALGSGVLWIWGHHWVTHMHTHELPQHKARP